MTKRPLEEQSQADLIAIIRSTRDEAAAARKRAEAYERAFERLTPGEQAGLLHIIEVFGENQQDGADLFKQLAESLLDSPEPKEDHTMSEQNPAVPAAPAVPPTLGAEQPPAWAQSLVAAIQGLNEKVESISGAYEQDRTQGLIREATAMGFQQGTPEFQELFRIAASLTDGDLEQAKGWYEAKHGPLAAAGTPPAEGAPAAAGAPPATAQGAAAQIAAAAPAAPAFPPAASGSVGAAPAAAPGGEPDLSKTGVRAQAKAYIDALAAGGIGTPSA